MAQLDQKRPIVGCVLVVKNEAADISHWLYWHIAIGFDEIIVYDDFSDDGTRDIVRSYKSDQRIELHDAISPRDDHYFHRQQRCYKDAIAKARGRLDWLCLIDADEYLFLREHQTIADFLKSFDDADGVAVNWCNYGSSGHVLKPTVSPVKAYTWHSKSDHPVNRHVKSIFRPDRVGGAWQGVHSFDIDPARYFLANGVPVVWAAEPGIIDGEPDWSVAKILHFQCRSMEHFVERMKRRPELHATIDHWNEVNFSDIQDLDPLYRHEEIDRASEHQRILGSTKVSLLSEGASSTLPRAAVCLELSRSDADCDMGSVGVQAAAKRSRLTATIDLGDVFAISEVNLISEVDDLSPSFNFANLVVDIGLTPEEFVEMLNLNAISSRLGAGDDSCNLKLNVPAPGRFVKIRLSAEGPPTLSEIQLRVMAAPEFVRSLAFARRDILTINGDV